MSTGLQGQKKSYTTLFMGTVCRKNPGFDKDKTDVMLGLTLYDFASFTSLYVQVKVCKFLLKIKLWASLTEAWSPRAIFFFFPFPSYSLPVLLSGLLSWLLGAQGLSEFTFLPGILRPDREGSLRLHQGGGILCPHPTERAPAASVSRASSMPGALLAFCVYQGRSSPALCFAILPPRSSSWGYPWILLGLDPGSYLQI